ncbi:SKI family transcriptional corepressor 1%2C partial [Xyrichtys novacula]|uniref:SKI family transcriptional corepressor 1, partial n=1 Tax=Xyrichtys novacula TaxID=13765 RepID=A0AAV1EKR2_XYRNO|nr:SKI family transcriptional corepressor 1%2C partial [Xyrichtys novacula]
MAVLALTYTDNMSAMRMWTLHDLIWRASVRDIDRALFGDASSFLPARDPHIPKFPASIASPLCIGR